MKIGFGEEETEVDASNLEWIPKKIIQRGKATGVTVDEQKGRWDAVIEFAQEREKQKRSERGKGKTKRKGARELNSLCSSINYERVKRRMKRRELQEEKVAGNSRGILLILNENTFMECQGAGGIIA